MTPGKILKQKEELERRLRKVLPGSEEETKIRAQLLELEARLADLSPEKTTTSASLESPLEASHIRNSKAKCDYYENIAGHIYKGDVHYHIYPSGPGTSTETTQPQDKAPPRDLSPVSLRSEPLTVSRKEARKVFGLNKKWQPRNYIQNSYDDLGDVLIDRRSGLMWQKDGSSEQLDLDGAQHYLKGLNNRDYTDWRLPTIPELISLLEAEEREHGLYISTLFESDQTICLSADFILTEEVSPPNTAWNVDFKGGLVRWDLLHTRYYIRAVRTWGEK